jgi:pilus assembly protein CpaE
MMDEQRLTIAILDPDRGVSSDVAQMLSADGAFEVSARASDERSLIGALRDRAADVVVLDLAGALAQPSILVREIAARRPGTCIIVTGRNAPASTVGRVIAAGAATYLPKPYEPEELIATIRDLRGIPPRPAAPPPPPTRRGALIAVYSPKGGVGTTTIATSLAVAFAGQRDARVAIVDLDLQFGDVGVTLDLKNAGSIADLLATPGPLDEALLADVFARHPTGVLALLAPEDPTDMRSVDAEEVVRSLDSLRTSFDYIVCDLWSSLEELSLAVLRAADRVVLVTTPEVPALRHLRRIMNATNPLLSSDRTVVVANRAGGKIGVSSSEIERVLGMPIAAAIPSDGIRVTKAINEGVSVMDARVGARAASVVRDFAGALVKDLGRRRETATARSSAAAS